MSRTSPPDAPAPLRGGLNPAGAPWGRALRIMLHGSLVLGAAMVLGAIVYHKLLLRQPDMEDCNWVTGGKYGHYTRTLQVFLLYQLYPRFWGPHFEPLYLLSIGLHLLTAVMIYALVQLLVTVPRTTFPPGRAARRLGGALAALLFVLYQAKPLVYLSALAYQLVTVFCLAALCLTLIHLKRRSLLSWLPVFLCFVLALISHSYSFGLLLLIGGLELAHILSAPGNKPGPFWGARYASLVLVLVGWILYNPIFTNQNEKLSGLISHPLDAALQFARLLQILVFDLVWYISPRVLNVYELSTRPLGKYEVPAPLLLAGLIVLGAWGVRGLYRLSGMGPGVAFLIFVLLWNLPSFWITQLAPDWDTGRWRFNYNVAGLCLMVPFILFALPWPRPGRLGKILTFVPSLLTATALVIFAAPGIASEAPGLVQGIAEGSLRNPGSCKRLPLCQGRSRSRPTRDELAAAKEGRYPCADLSNLDLSGLDLRGFDLRGANLSRTRMVGTRLDAARLDGACFNWSVLREVNLDGAQLGRATMSGVLLDGTGLSRAQTLGLKLFCHRIVP